MKQKILGKTGTKISVIGVGTAHYPYNNSLTESLLASNIGFSSYLGMTFIDTSEIYGNGLSEMAIGAISPDIKKKIFISTKVSAKHLHSDDLKKAAENSLHRLKIDCIDLYYIHWPNPKISIEESMQAMAELVDEGKIKYIGLSNFSLKGLKAAIAISPKEISALQVEYNLLDRGIEKDILPFCQSNGITLVASSPLNQGDLVSSETKVDVLKILAQKYQRTVAQIILNWLVIPFNVAVIPKAINPIHILENSNATDFVLENDDVELIHNSFQPKILEIPVDEIKVIPGGQGDRQVYKTLEEAKQNALKLVPSPEELAQEIIKGDVLKPVRVVFNADKNSKYKYNLVEGRVRYWAWVIAFDGKKPISALIR